MQRRQYLSLDFSTIKIFKILKICGGKINKLKTLCIFQEDCPIDEFKIKQIFVVHTHLHFPFSFLFIEKGKIKNKKCRVAESGCSVTRYCVSRLLLDGVTQSVISGYSRHHLSFVRVQPVTSPCPLRALLQRHVGGQPIRCRYLQLLHMQQVLNIRSIFLGFLLKLVLKLTYLLILVGFNVND